MKSLLVASLLWINQNTGIRYDVALGLPTVQRVSQEVLASERYGGELSRSETDGIKSEIAALYDHKNKRILVGDYVDFDTVHGRSALVHELVHFIQYEKGVAAEAPCVRSLERDAYRIQSRYLKQHGLVPEFDEFTVAVRSLCADVWQSVP